jgi:hypothetical protein
MLKSPQSKINIKEIYTKWLKIVIQNQIILK